MTEPIFELGGIESPKDLRDYLGTGQPIGVAPATYLPNNSSLPVYDQITGTGGQTACGGASGGKLQNILLGFQGQLSWRFVFALTTKLTGIPPDQGTYARAIMQVLQKYGVPRADLWPNDTSLTIQEFADWTKITPQAYIDALSRRIGPYAQLTDLSRTGLTNAIYQNKAVLVLKSPWTPASWDARESHSGHFFDLDGYSGDKTRFSNSFGPGWGTNANGGGNGEGFLLDSDLATIREAWIAYEPTPMPVPHYVFTRDLSVGSTGEDVRQLQKFLNTHGFQVAPVGDGSPGHESTFFGQLTKNALGKFQAANGITPTAGYFGTISRTKINATP